MASLSQILRSGLFTFKHGNASAIPASSIGFFYLSSNESYGDLIPQPSRRCRSGPGGAWSGRLARGTNKGRLRMNYHADRRTALLDATTPAQPEAAPLAASVIAAGKLEVSAEKRKIKLRPLVFLAPYVKRYHCRAIFAFGALILAALDVDRADRGAAYDRFRLFSARHRSDRLLFRGADRRSGDLGARERAALLSSRPSASASSPICAATCSLI